MELNKAFFSAVTVEDEIKLCSDLINKFVQVVSYQQDFEEQLNFYVECRSSFIKLDAVLITLVHVSKYFNLFYYVWIKINLNKLHGWAQ